MLIRDQKILHVKKKKTFAVFVYRAARRGVCVPSVWSPSPHALRHHRRSAQAGGGRARVRLRRRGHHHQAHRHWSCRSVLAPGFHRRALINFFIFYFFGGGGWEVGRGQRGGKKERGVNGMCVFPGGGRRRDDVMWVRYSSLNLFFL